MEQDKIEESVYKLKDIWIISLQWTTSFLLKLIDTNWSWAPPFALASLPCCMSIRYAYNESIVYILFVIGELFKTCDFENECEIVAAQVNKAIIFVAYTDRNE